MVSLSECPCYGIIYSDFLLLFFKETKHYRLIRNISDFVTATYSFSGPDQTYDEKQSSDRSKTMRPLKDTEL